MMKPFMVALVLTGLLMLTAQAISWKHWVEAEAWYLKEPSVRLSDGRVLTRKDLLDLLIAERLKP